MNIFISYRRADTQDLAGRIADRLRALPGINEVFLDVTGIAPGTDFSQRIEAALSLKPVCIVLVGPAWRGPRETIRIFDAHDVVRMELARMLADALRILPVIAGGATMPLQEELPDDIKKFAALNALPMRHDSFERDLAALVDAILARAPGSIAGGASDRYPLGATLLRALISFLISGAALIVAADLHNEIVGRSLDETLGGPGQVWLLTLGALSLGTLVGAFTRWSRQRRPADNANALPVGRSDTS